MKTTVITLMQMAIRQLSVCNRVFSVSIKIVFQSMIRSVLIALFLLIPITNSKQDPANKQISKWGKTHERVPATGINYQKVPSLMGTLGVGPRGPLLLQDFNIMAHLASIATERIPERVVHAKAAGAKGYFKLTHDMSKYTKAQLFTRVGKKTPIVVRFSSAAGQIGQADTKIDMRGFSIKFKTTQGVYDLTTLNAPATHSRDPILFVPATNSRARNAQTNIFDQNAYFDYTLRRPESVFNVFLINSNLSFFQNYRHLDGHSINSYAWTGGSETKSEPVFVRYRILPNRKPKTFSRKKLDELAGTDPDYMLRDLYNAIARKRFPSYTLYVQMFTYKDVKEATYNLFDVTKILFQSDFPLIPVGKLVLNENPTDYFSEVEQVAFNPGHLIPGIEMSPDRSLQGRPFAYHTAQLHRLGTNFYQLPINRPLKGSGHSYLRNGFMNFDGNGDGGPNFYPNSYNGPFDDPKAKNQPFKVEGGVMDAYDIKDKDDFGQIDRYWREVLSPKQRQLTVDSIVFNLKQASKSVRERSLKGTWDKINDEIKTMIRQGLAKATSNSEGSNP